MFVVFSVELQEKQVRCVSILSVHPSKQGAEFAIAEYKKEFLIDLYTEDGVEELEAKAEILGGLEPDHLNLDGLVELFDSKDFDLVYDYQEVSD